MAIFDFIATVGKKLFDSAHTGAGHDSKNAQTLTQHLEKLGLDLKDAVVKMQGDKVTLEGNASTQETMEKAVLALGNVMESARSNPSFWRRKRMIHVFTR